ncbi:MAG: zinc ribbon domain-containing protein [Dehalococcoidales bacterium]|nr:zinc ribbon domain-containing protein [Dehalococcoidales bacterium]
MPIYQYECSTCRCEFERKQRFDDDPVVDCPKCHAKAYRVFCPVPIIFKGSGFYVTENRKSTGEPEKATTKSPISKVEKSKSEGTTTAGNQSLG